jgi:hypothetical protein
MIDQKRKRQLGAAALKDLLFLTRIDNPKYSPPAHSPQAQARRGPSLDALGKLLDAASSLEAS